MEPGFILSVECVDAAALAGWLKGAPSVENFIWETTDLEVASLKVVGGGQEFLGAKREDPSQKAVFFRVRVDVIT